MSFDFFFFLRLSYLVMPRLRIKKNKIKELRLRISASLVDMFIFSFTFNPLVEINIYIYTLKVHWLHNRNGKARGPCPHTTRHGHTPANLYFRNFSFYPTTTTTTTISHFPKKSYTLLHPIGVYWKFSHQHHIQLK